MSLVGQVMTQARHQAQGREAPGLLAETPH